MMTFSCISIEKDPSDYPFVLDTMTLLIKDSNIYLFTERECNCSVSHSPIFHIFLTVLVHFQKKSGVNVLFNFLQTFYMCILYELVV